MLHEVGEGDAAARAVDQVVGDDRALEGELDIKRHLAGTGGDVAGDLDVVGGEAADGGEGATVDAVAGDDDAVRLGEVDAVAVLAGAAGIGADCR